jgi:hypothetical protein
VKENNSTSSRRVSTKLLRNRFPIDGCQQCFRLVAAIGKREEIKLLTEEKKNGGDLERSVSGRLSHGHD